MNANAGSRFSVKDTLLIKRFCLSVFSCICLLIFLTHSAHADKKLFSSAIDLVQNNPQETILQWNFENEPTKSEHTILLFVHGPVSSASCFLDSFAWVHSATGNIVATGNKTDFPSEFQPRFPIIQLREIGYFAGCRAASLTIRFQLQDQLRQTGNKVIDFPSGKIKILFPQMDEEQFIRFPKALDEAARSLYINYPPLRKIEETHPAFTEMPYIKNPSIKLITTQEGLYEIPAIEIMNRLHTINISADSIALFQNKIPVSRVIFDQFGKEKKTGKINIEDTIRFFAPKSQSAFSSETVTWLSLYKESVILPKPLELSKSNQSSQLTYKRIALEQDVEHIEGRKRNEEQSRHWMWHFFEKGPFNTEFSIHEPVAEAACIVRIFLDAKSDSNPIEPGHIYSVINTTQVTGEITHNPPNKFELEAQFPSMVFIQDNTMSITIDEAFQQTNSLALDKVEIFYPVQTKPSNEPLFNLLDAAELQIPNDTQSVWGISSDQNKSTVYFNNEIGDNESLKLTDNIKNFYFLPAKPILLSPTIESVTPESNRTVFLSQAKQADVIILSPRDWQSAFDSYHKSLEKQSLTSIFVAAEDVYDLYGDGRMSPFALRDFIRHAYHTWDDPKPSYVVLAGDATWDYWGRYQNGIINNLPAYQGDGNYAIENWFVRCDDPNDKLPDMVISRIPVRTVEELQTVIEKTVAYRENPPIGNWLNQVLVLTDDEFEEYTSELLEDWIPTGFQISDRHVKDYPLVDNIYLPTSMRQKMRAKTSLDGTRDIINILNQGVFLWEFFGHGAPNVMGKQRLFFGGGSKYSDVKKLMANSKPSILWSFSCETTRFDYPLDKWNISIGEDLLTLPNGGAVALMGATGRGYPQDHILLGKGLHEAAFDYSFSTFGLQYFSAQMMSLAFKQSFEPIDQFAILGDPVLPMPRFIELPLTISEKNNHYYCEIEYPEKINHPIDGGAWIQNEDGTQSEILEKETSLYGLPEAMSINKELAQKYKNGKIGEYFIAKENNRILIGHGSVKIPMEQTSSEKIEPTTGLLPDIAFAEESLKLQPDEPRSGETIFIEVDIINKGKASAQNITVQGYSVDHLGTESLFDVVVGSKYFKIELLNPNQKQKIKLRWDPTANAGDNTFRIKADSELQVDESDETNNSIEGTIVVKKKADLTINNEYVRIVPSANGMEYRVSFKVINEGESTAERVLIQCKVVMNGQENILTLPIDRSTKTVKPATLVPQGVYSANEFGIPISIDSFEINVDPDEIVDEETRDNNIYTFQPSQN